MKSPECAAQRARQGEIYKTWYLRMRHVLPFTVFLIILFLSEYKAVPFCYPLSCLSLFKQEHSGKRTSHNELSTFLGALRHLQKKKFLKSELHR